MSSITSARRIALVLFIFALAKSATAALDDHNPVGVTGVFDGVVTTGCAYSVPSHNVTRQIDDIVVAGAIGKYGLKMTRYYNSRRTSNSGPMGPGWTPEYFWTSSSGKTTYPNGNVWDNSCDAPVGVSDSPTTWNGSPAFRLADGGTVVFDNGLWPAVASKIIDPYGQITSITLDAASGRITKVTEPGGRYLQFVYSVVNGVTMLHEVDAYDGPQGNRIDYVVYNYIAKDPGGGHPFVNCLTSVDYSDGTHANYTYEQDNVPEDLYGGSIKIFPLVNGCDDVRYHGAMRRIAYDYQVNGPHGAITAERYWNGVPGNEGSGVTVSSIGPVLNDPRLTAADFPVTFTEIRGDGPTRTFNYTDMHLHLFEGDTCPTSTLPPYLLQQFIESYTDFQGHTTYIGYDTNWYVNSVQDANGHTTTYTRGPAPPTGIGQITKITHHDTTHIDYTYQPETGSIPGHYLQQITDERGNITYYTRDTNHRITRIDYKNAAGTVLAYETFSYNDFDQVLTHRLKNGANESSTYGGRGLLIDKYNPKFDSVPGGTDPHTHYDYYTSADGKLGWIDRVKKMTLPANVSGQVASETYEYDRALGADGVTDPNGAPVSGRGLVTKITHADNNYQSFGYDAYGNKRWEENELLQENTYTYDDYKRLLTVKNPLNKTTTYTYVPTNGVGGSSYKHTTSNADTVTTPTGIVTSNVYDQNFRKTSTTAADGTALAATTWLHYDAVGNQDYVTDPRGTSTPGTYTTYTDYDSRNRKWQVREPLGHTMQLYYDDGINITRIIRAVGTPDATTETKAYDGMNRLTSDTVPKSTNPTVNIVTQFTYYPSNGDANGHSGSLLWQVIDPNNHYFSFEYDPFGSKTKMTYPGNVSYQFWAYDGAHNLKSRTTLNAETQNFTYDYRNRKTGMSWSNGADSATYGYDIVGRLTSATNANSTVTRQYDAAGHLTLDQQNVTGLGIKSVNYPTYDGDGRLTRMYVPGAAGYDFTYSYDEMGRFETILLTTGGQLFQYHYDAASNDTQRDNLYNGVNQIYPRDALNRIQYVDVKKDATTLSHEWYTYDAMNRITLVSYGTGNTDSFTYYLDGELKQAVLGDLDHTLTYNLDSAGNRTSVVDSVNGTTTYSPNSSNQYTSVTGNSISNGPEHEISAFNNVTYTYINDEHLRQVSDGMNIYTMAYDALGRCVKRTLNNGQASLRPTPTPHQSPTPRPSPSPTPTPEPNELTTYYIYDGEKPVLEYDPNGTSVGVNVYGKGIDEILERVAVGVGYYPQQNHEGSVMLLTDATPNGNVIERYRYDAFGAPTFYTGTWGARSNTIYDNRFLFTGREYAATYRATTNAAFNFYEYRARAYNPKLGRFMSEDPKLFDAGDYNLFRYCHNDPIDFSDPMGTDSDVWTRTIERIQAYANSKEMFGGGAIEIGSLRYAAAQMQSFTMAYTSQSQQRMYTYSLKSQHNIGDLSGARGYQYVWNSNDNCNGQCLTTVQHLSGAPSSATPLLRGDPVGPNTKQGTAIATGFRNINGQWIYPSKPPKDFGPSERINHAAFYVAPIGRGFMQTLEAQRGIAIHLSRPQPTEGWYELTSRLLPNASSTSQLHSAGGLYGPFY